MSNMITRIENVHYYTIYDVVKIDVQVLRQYGYMGVNNYHYMTLSLVVCDCQALKHGMY